MLGDLTLDFETRSTVDLRTAGAALYAESSDTHVWCAAYAFGDGEIKVWKEGDPCPPEIAAHVRVGGIVRAFNSFFEMVIWLHIMGPRHHWPIPKIEQYRCTMTAGMAMALPGSLKMMGAALGLDTGKADEEHRQMLQLSKPRRARKDEDPNGIYWFDDAERIQRLHRICINDVRSERDVLKHILPLRPSELALWHLDQRINLRGIHVDVPLCKAALSVVDTAAQWLNGELAEITDDKVTKTTAVAQIVAWLGAKGVSVDSLDKAHIAELLERSDLAEDVRRVLEIRAEAAKAAVKKIAALLAGTSADSRARGLLQFHAASTGRWSGRRFQPQNIARPKNKKLVPGYIDAIATGSAAYVSMVEGEPLAVVSDCLRGMVGAAPGNVIFAADFSNIEGRLTAWLAGEEWKLQAFRDFDAGVGHDIYKMTAGKILGIDPTEVDGGEKDGPQRQGSGKVPELALGYQGGVGAFQNMAKIYGVVVSDERAEEIKVAWRDEHPMTVQLWYDLERAATDAIRNPGTTFFAGAQDRIAFRVAGTFLYMRLPSGRAIVYPFPCIKRKLMPWTTQGEMLLPERQAECYYCPAGRRANDDICEDCDGTGVVTRPPTYRELPVWKDSVCYKGVDQFTRQWSDQFAHGGLLANNAVQGTARDIEAEAMVRVEAAGYPIVLTVHDEIVAEAATGDIEDFKELMATLPTWAEGLPLAVSGFTDTRYRK